MTNPIPSDWQSWIALNRERGCTEESMLDAMGQAGVDVVRAKAWLVALPALVAVGSALPLQTTVAAAPARVAAGLPYHYEASMLPLHNDVPLVGTTARISMRMQTPDIALIENFLTVAECDELIALSQAKLRTSTVVDPATGKHVPIANRSSEGAMFQRGENPVVQRVEQRIAELLNWPVDNGEGLQVLHYRPGGEYKPHYDYFPPEQSGSAVQMRVGGQRIATLIMYLNEVPGGGATIFPNVGLDVAPRKGTAVWFSYCNSDGQLDSQTLHGGAPVLTGEKWIATKWLRQQRYG